MRLLLMLFTIASLGTLQGQTAEESSVNISLGSKAAYVIEVAGATDKIAENVLKDFLKDELDTKAKKNKKAKEWYAEKAMLSGVNRGAPVDLYIVVEEGRGLTRVFFAADRGDAFISSNDTPDDAKAMASIVEQYGAALQRYVINEEIEEREKELKDLEKDLEKLGKKNEDYHEDIKKAEDKIAEAKDNIEQNLKDQENKRLEIENKIKEVETTTARYNDVGRKM